MKKIKNLFIVLIASIPIYIMSNMSNMSKNVNKNFININKTIYKFEKDEYRECNFIKSGNIEIINKIGSINIESFDKEKIEINITKKAKNRSDLENIKLNLNIKKNNAFIKVNSPEESEVDLNIKVPKNSNLKLIKIDLGNINIKNINGNINAIIETGNIKISEIENSDINSEIETGNIKISEIENSDINSEIETGHIKISKIKNSNIKAEIKTGSIELYLNSNSNALIDASVNTGKVNSDFNQIKIKSEFPFAFHKATGELSNNQTNIKNNINLKVNTGSISIKKD